MKQINTLLTPFLSKDSWKNQLLDRWPHIMGTLDHQVTLEKIYEDTLILGVRDSAWLHELYMLSPVIIERINAKLDMPRIKQLRFKQKVRKSEIHKKEVISYKKLKPIVFTRQEEKALQDIHDDALRCVLKDFLIRCYKERI